MNAQLWGLLYDEVFVIRVISFFLLALFLPSAALAQQWVRQELRPDLTQASIAQNGAGLAVRCGYRNSMQTSVRGFPAHGKVAFRFNDGTAVYADFLRGEFLARSDKETELFGQIVSMLRKANSVQVTIHNGYSTNFPLTGSSAALQGCAGGEIARGIDPKSPLSQTEVVELQRNMQNLGKYDGPIDGSLRGPFATRLAQFAVIWMDEGRNAAPRQVLEKTRQLVRDERFMANLRANEKKRAERHQVYANIKWEVLAQPTSRTIIGTPNSGGRIEIRCLLVGASRGLRSTLSIGNSSTPYISGPYEAQVDGGKRYAFKNGSLTIDTEGLAASLTELLQDMARGNQLVVRESNGRQTVYPLTGSAKAIGPCTLPQFPYKLKSKAEEEAIARIGPDKNGRFNGQIRRFTMASAHHNGLWCAPHTTIMAQYSASDFDPQTARTPPTEISEFATAMRAACPKLRSVQVAYGVNRITWAQIVPPGMIQIVGAHDGFTSHTTYDVLEQNLAPESANACDRYAALKNDFDKPLGLAPVLPGDVQASGDALNACRTAILGNPDVRRHYAHYARLLAHAGAFDQAVQIATDGAKRDSGAALLILGTLQVEGWGTEVDMDSGNRNWGRANFFGGRNAVFSRNDIARSSGATIRPTREEEERAKALALLTGLAASIGNAQKGGTFDICNKSQVPIRMAMIATTPIENARVFIEGYWKAAAGECARISGDVAPLMVFGIAIEYQYGEKWLPYEGRLENSDASIPHRFSHVCVPQDDSFVRNEFGLMGRNPCRAGDKEMDINFNIRVGNRTNFTMNIN